MPRKVSTATIYAAIAIPSLLFLALILPNVKPFPYSDDWAYVGPLFTFPRFDISWLFAQHNDHRIPLQKALHVAILWASGGDFRAIVFSNFLLALVCAFFIMRTASELRGSASLGDAGITLILLNPGFNVFYWSFSFQFLSTVFFASASLYFLAAYSRTRSLPKAHSAAICLMLCSLTGGNGVIVSSIISLFVLGALLYSRQRLAQRGGVMTYALFWACVALNATLVLSWRPSAATLAIGAPIDLGIVVVFFAQMLKSWLCVFAGGHAVVKIVISGAMLSGGVYIASRPIIRSLSRRESVDMADAALCGSMVAAFCVILVTSFSRARIQPWTPGLELHYGYLAVLIPVICWLVVSRVLSASALRIVGVVFLASCVWMYWNNARWRLADIRSSAPKAIAAQSAILGPLSSKEVVDKHIGQFYYFDSPEARASVTHALDELRTNPQAWFHHPNQQQ